MKDLVLLSNSIIWSGLFFKALEINLPTSKVLGALALLNIIAFLRGQIISINKCLHILKTIKTSDKEENKMLQKFLKTIAILLLAFIPQFLIDAYKEIKTVWAGMPVKKTRTRKSGKKAAPKKTVTPRKRAPRKPKAAPIAEPAA